MELPPTPSSEKLLSSGILTQMAQGPTISTHPTIVI